MQIHKPEYEFTRLDIKNYFHFCEWKEALEWKNTKQKRERFI